MPDFIYHANRIRTIFVGGRRFISVALKNTNRRLEPRGADSSGSIRLGRSLRAKGLQRHQLRARGAWSVGAMAGLTLEGI